MARTYCQSAFCIAVWEHNSPTDCPSSGEGEAAVQTAFPGAVIIRSAVMFAPDDAFLTTILRLLRSLPAYPMFGDGRKRLQPAYADDVAAAIAEVVRQSKKPYPIYELAGPRVYSYEELLRTIARSAGLRPVLVRMPFAFWHAVAGLAEILPQPRSTLRPQRTGRDFAHSEFLRDRLKKNSKQCSSVAKLKTQKTPILGRG
jgi:uncharacterized protein YbjT (DUF2867 family)